MLSYSSVREVFCGLKCKTGELLGDMHVSDSPVRISAVKMKLVDFTFCGIAGPHFAGGLVKDPS